MGFFGVKTDFVGIEMKVFEMIAFKDTMPTLKFCQNPIEFQNDDDVLKFR